MLNRVPLRSPQQMVNARPTPRAAPTTAPSTTGINPQETQQIQGYGYWKIIWAIALLLVGLAISASSRIDILFTAPVIGFIGYLLCLAKKYLTS